MKVRPPSPRLLLGLFGALAFFGGLALITVNGAPHGKRNAAPPAHPSLFGAGIACSAGARTFDRAARLERQAYLHAERYPYDPRDGIRAVARLQEAESCYGASGRDAEVGRVARRASVLVKRINVDYASARLALATAIDAEKWSLARTELRRLLRLTQHLRGNDYVMWLEEIAGKVELRARSVP